MTTFVAETDGCKNLVWGFQKYWHLLICVSCALCYSRINCKDLKMTITITSRKSNMTFKLRCIRINILDFIITIFAVDCQVKHSFSCRTSLCPTSGWKGTCRYLPNVLSVIKLAAQYGGESAAYQKFLTNFQNQDLLLVVYSN